MRLWTAGRPTALAFVLLASLPAAAADDLPKMKFNDVKEIAPGVFFRYSSISATDQEGRLRRQQ